MYGFPEDWQIQISAVFLALYGEKDKWLVEEVINAASHVIGNKKPGSLSFSPSTIKEDATMFKQHAVSVLIRSVNLIVKLHLMYSTRDLNLPLLLTRPFICLPILKQQILSLETKMYLVNYSVTNPADFAKRKSSKDTCNEYLVYREGNLIVLSIRKTDSNVNNETESNNSYYHSGKETHWTL
jgi:hypothetical protein